MITDTELLKMLMQKYPLQDAEFVMNEFNTYKKLLGTMACDVVEEKNCECGTEAVEVAQASAPAVPVPAPVKKLTKRQIKHKPEEAITQADIRCCVCGKVFKRLSAAHLASHGTTPEEYRRLCGYAPNAPLMGKAHYQRLMNAVKSAQEARVRKRAMLGGTEDL